MTIGLNFRFFLICRFFISKLLQLKLFAIIAMMGEYIIYLRGKIAAYLCDNRLLVKIVPAALGMMPTAKKESPYAGASEMLRVNEEDISEEFLKELFEAMYPELPEPKKKKK